MKSVLVPLAQGFEEAEFIGIVDVLRRAGLKVLVAGLHDACNVVGANGVSIKAEVKLCDIDSSALDGIALAGGFEGMQNLANDSRILQIIKDLHAKRKLVAAICASPIVLHKAGVLSKEFTCYPGCEEGLSGTRLQESVVVRDNIITSAGPATAILFGLAIVKALLGDSVSRELYAGMQMPLLKEYAL